MGIPTNFVKKFLHDNKSSSQVNRQAKQQRKASRERKRMTFLRRFTCGLGGPPPTMDDKTPMVDHMAETSKSSSTSFVPPVVKSASGRRMPQNLERRRAGGHDAYITTDNDNKSQISEITEASYPTKNSNSMFQDKLSDSLGSQRSLLLWSQYAPLAKDVPLSPSAVSLSKSVSTCHTRESSSSIVGMSMYDDRIPQTVRGRHDFSPASPISCSSSFKGEMDAWDAIRHSYSRNSPARSPAKRSSSTFQEESFQMSPRGRLYPCEEQAEEECTDSVILPIYY